MEEQEYESALSKHWHVVVYLVGLVFMGGIMYGNISALAEDHIDYERRFKEDDTREVRDAIDINRLKNEQDHINEDIDEIKKDVKENSDKLDQILDELRKRD